LLDKSFFPTHRPIATRVEAGPERLTESIAGFFGAGVSADAGMARNPEFISTVRARKFILSTLVKSGGARSITADTYSASVSGLRIFQ
jgi:hypothetical protein